jgi:glycosyltransferase involved in cell wall biosynthesis
VPSLSKRQKKGDMGVFIGENNWTFFNEICDDLKLQYRTDIFRMNYYRIPFFQARFNRWNLNKGINSFLSSHDVCFFEWASELLALASHMPKQCAIVTRLHSFELYEWASKIDWQAVDQIILVSRTMQSRFNKLFPSQSYKTAVVHNGVRLEKFKPSGLGDFRFVFGMLCNITPIKRIYDVVLMLHNLREKGYRFQLCIGGEPRCGDDLRYLAAIRSLVEKLDMDEFIIFDGYIGDTPTWLQKIDIFISNSYWEGQQVALLEAMASGCYCLSHNWDGVEEILPEENIFIAEPDFLIKMVDYINISTAEKVACSKTMREIAETKFDISRTKEQIRKIIEETRL